MRMSNEQKIDTLLNSFDELKDQFWGNGDNIAEIIRKMFEMVDKVCYNIVGEIVNTFLPEAIFKNN